jgi:hypothetical protein
MEVLQILIGKSIGKDQEICQAAVVDIPSARRVSGPGTVNIFNNGC